MNNEKILAHVRMFVLREKLLCPGEPLHLAAAVSGGADSMALLRIWPCSRNSGLCFRPAM